MQQNKRKLKPHKLEALPLKLVLQASEVIQTKWMLNYNIEPKKSNSAKLLCYFRSCLHCKITYEVLMIKYTG